MAIVTRTIGRLVDDVSGLTAHVELDYDNVDLRARTIRVVNPTSRALVIEAARLDRSRVYSQTFAAGQTSTLTTPTTAANRLQCSIHSTGKLNGIEWAMRWVVP